MFSQSVSKNSQKILKIFSSAQCGLSPLVGLHPTPRSVQSADVLFACTFHIFDVLRGIFNARVRAPQGCERAGLDWSALSSASARQASKITFASAKGRPSISRECSGKTDQASPQGAADKDRLAVVGRPTKPPAHTAVETVALNPLGKCVRKGWGV